MIRSRLYLVEDEALIAMELRDRLTALGYEIAGHAARGERALVEIPALRPDVVLMDIRLAGEPDGIETARRLAPLLDVPVVFLTAFSETQLVEEAVAAGGFGYLVKPFEERELDATIQSALAKHRAQQRLRGDNARLTATVAERTAELRTSESAAQLFRSLVERVDDAIAVVDPATGRFLDFNERACLDLGYTRAELLALRVADIDPEADAEKFAANVAAMRAAGITTFESVNRRKDGTTFPVEVRVSHIHQERDYLVAVVRDISARRRAEATARERAAEIARLSAFQETLLDHTGLAIFSATVDGVVTSFNVAAEKLFGHAAADVVGRAAFTDFHDATELAARAGLLSEELGRRVPAGFAVLAAGPTAGGPETREWSFVRKDGTRFPGLLTFSAIRGERGELAGFLGVLRELELAAPVPPPVAAIAPSQRATVRRIATLAIGYAAVGLASKLLSIPPGYATPIWPAAGLALGALMVWGWRCWPGVWLGAFAVGAWHDGNMTSAAELGLTTLTAAGLASAI
ncbi:MAG: hypothetical protein RLZZ15_1271, partial [Verrucomicrobiota bacterium]